MSHLSVSVTFTADDVHIAHEGVEHPACHQIEIRPTIGANVGLFGGGAGGVDAVRSLREALAKAVVLLDSRLLLLEGGDAHGCTGERYLVNPDAPEEGTDVHHGGNECPVHPDALEVEGVPA